MSRMKSFLMWIVFKEVRDIEGLADNEMVSVVLDVR
jgi:hypothetical protein